MPGDPSTPSPGAADARGAPAGAVSLDHRRVHLVGVGGAGMSGIARVLLARGCVVSGSDAKDSRTLGALRALGARVAVGHDAAHLGDADVLVVSAAIRADNPELLAATRSGVEVLRRADALGRLMVGRRGVAVAGTHGKTTTTSMLVRALQRAGADPSFAIGGDLNEPGSNAHHGLGELFVAEADESDGSFLLLDPQAAVVTNVEPEHLDHYGSGAAVDEAFAAFVARLPPDGFLVSCADDAGARRAAAAARASVTTYGAEPGADLQVADLLLTGGGSRSRVSLRGRRLGDLVLQVPGRHNALNAAAALAAGIALGRPAVDLLAGLSAYAGVRRRFELKGAAAGVRVYDDYAHHPTEVAATLAAARDVAGGGRLVVAFQPHRYSRTAVFAEALGAALGAADDVVVLEVYAAGEDPVPGASGARVAAAVPRRPGRAVTFHPSWLGLAAELAGRARPGDLVLTLGAGDITLLGPDVVEQLEARA